MCPVFLRHSRSSCTEWVGDCEMMFVAGACVAARCTYCSSAFVRGPVLEFGLGVAEVRCGFWLLLWCVALPEMVVEILRLRD